MVCVKINHINYYDYLQASGLDMLSLKIVPLETLILPTCNQYPDVRMLSWQSQEKKYENEYGIDGRSWHAARDTSIKGSTNLNLREAELRTIQIESSKSNNLWSHLSTCSQHRLSWKSCFSMLSALEHFLRQSLPSLKVSIHSTNSNREQRDKTLTAPDQGLLACRIALEAA